MLDGDITDFDTTLRRMQDAIADGAQKSEVQLDPGLLRPMYAVRSSVPS